MRTSQSLPPFSKGGCRSGVDMQTTRSSPNHAVCEDTDPSQRGVGHRLSRLPRCAGWRVGDHDAQAEAFTRVSFDLSERCADVDSAEYPQAARSNIRASQICATTRDESCGEAGALRAQHQTPGRRYRPLKGVGVAGQH